MVFYVRDLLFGPDNIALLVGKNYPGPGLGFVGISKYTYLFNTGSVGEDRDTRAATIVKTIAEGATARKRSGKRTVDLGNAN